MGSIHLPLPRVLCRRGGIWETRWKQLRVLAVLTVSLWNIENGSVAGWRLAKGWTDDQMSVIGGFYELLLFSGGLASAWASHSQTHALRRWSGETQAGFCPCLIGEGSRGISARGSVSLRSVWGQYWMCFFLVLPSALVPHPKALPARPPFLPSDPLLWNHSPWSRAVQRQQRHQINHSSPASPPSPNG